ncbi:hypothetical protein [Ferviditalea candida]|uniref:Uncharacterized protein n=1 Tax=Ferviditalea candida TaxID=3108399 RepID=A0ABU5ZCJ0_9BACL|nr:hypothetical protein [Paenibacillaceae bacterium T2]
MRQIRYQIGRKTGMFNVDDQGHVIKAADEFDSTADRLFPEAVLWRSLPFITGRTAFAAILLLAVAGILVTAGLVITLLTY